MQQDLLEALSTGWIEKTLKVSRTSVATWRGGKFPKWRQTKLLEAVRPLLWDEKEAPPPKWAKRLQTNVAAILEAADRLEKQLAVMRAIIAAIPSPAPPVPGDQPGDPSLPRTERKLDQ